MRVCNRGVVLATVLAVWVCAALAAAQTALKTIDNPKGGHIVYGPVDGQSTEAGAMGAVLRSLHNQYGDKPQVGKVFQVKGTNSVAAFFTMTKHNQGNMQIAGLVIAAQPTAGHVEAALVTDEASRFGSTVNPMLTTLFQNWHPGGSAQDSVAGNGGVGGKAVALHTFTLPDNSASVGLPDGWRVQPNSGMGTMFVEGPNGEAAALGFPYLASDTNNPSVRQTMASLQRGALQNTSYAKALYYPYGGDLGKTFVDLLNMARSKQGQGPVTVKIASETPVQFPPPWRCAHLLGQIDPQDGKGMREMNTIFCSSPPARFGSYMNIAYHTALPMAVADKERATMGAVLASFTPNETVIRQQAGAIAAPEIGRIHEIGRQAAQQAADAHAAEDAHNRSVEKRWDDQDKQNQAFSNYLLDQTVIQDNYNNTHGTVWNQTADAMVKNNPDRYSYVDTPNFWKGVDY
ncbi:MAG TPA: hypothetical protein VF753_18865 [Terriglobales bacterium]